MTTDTTTLLRAIARAVIEAVRAGGDHGAPGGTLYAALMTQGCTLEQFEQIMGALCDAGALAKRGHLYFVA